ncbi:RnfABCDGE type electron transport complex subunit D [Ruminococcaceae bacterium OttesenSCG-928-I18]|nr:RnfABCDGE type electron transport complex subunit D [Ruminococcaceae bacterium OttesenSCG-928-I18]
MAEFRMDKNESAEVFEKNKESRFPALQASPHLRRGSGTRAIMGNVLLALLPATLGSVWFFGPAVLPYYLVAVFFALAADALAQFLRKRRVDTFDLSPVVTGVLLAMSMPLGTPLWFAALGPALGILVAKELFGGIGYNFLNPALLGRAVLRLAFPQQMSMNPAPSPPFGLGQSVDAVASATPLITLKEGGTLSAADLLDSFLGMAAGKIGETSALLLLLGAVWLLAKGIIRLRIPLAFLAGIALMAFVFGGNEGLFGAGWQTVLGHLLGGATMLGAFFMVTDYGSSPSAPLAQILFGALCGVVTMLFRLYSPFPEGFTFAVLIVNFSVPLLNRVIRPRVLGEKNRSLLS